MSYYFWLGRDGEMAIGGHITQAPRPVINITHHFTPPPNGDITRMAALIRSDVAQRMIREA